MLLKPFAEVKPHGGTPTVFIDGQPVPYHLAWFQTPGREELDSFKRVVAATARRTGVHLYAFENGTVSMGAGRPWIPGPREGHDGDYDLDVVAEDFLPFLEADPEARFHVRLYMEYNPEWATNKWWSKRHPEECLINNRGWQAEESFASLVWRAQVKDFIGRFVAHVDKLGLLERIVALQVNAGSTCEWFKYPLQVGDLCGDYSPPMQRYFRGFLRQRYGNDEAVLRAAWADANVTFETAEVPTHAQQFAARHYLLRDPATEQRAIDYLRATSALHADVIEDFAGTVKAVTQRRVLAGVFCGYWIGFQLNSDYFRDGTELPGAHTRLQRTGHLAFHRLVQCPDIDFFVSPLDYGFRGIGGHTAAMIPNGTVHAHGKIYIQENDERCWHPTRRDYGAVRSGADFRAVYRRTLADAIIAGMGTWSTAIPWLVEKAEHIPGHSSGIMHSDAVKDLPADECSRSVDNFADCHRIDRLALTLDRTPSAEICVLLDDESFYHQTYLKNLELPSVYELALRTLPHLGAPAEFHVLNDFLAGRLRPFKLYVFVNAYQLDDTRRAQLKRQLQRRRGAGKPQERPVALWLYAGGVLNRELSVDHMAEVTGFRCEMTRTPWGPFMHVTDFTHPITRGLPEDITWGTDLNLSPTFYVQDPDARVLGNVVHAQGRCAEGLAVKEFARWRSVFCATPNMPPAVLRGVARYAGVHLYGEAGDVLYAGRELLAVHTVGGGARTFQLPRKAGVVMDLFTRKVVARNTRRFTVKLPKVSTTMWYTGPAAKAKRR